MPWIPFVEQKLHKGGGGKLKSAWWEQYSLSVAWKTFEHFEIWLNEGIATFLENEIIQMIPTFSNPQETEGK